MGGILTTIEDRAVVLRNVSRNVEYVLENVTLLQTPGVIQYPPGVVGMTREQLEKILWNELDNLYLWVQPWRRSWLEKREASP